MQGVNHCMVMGCLSLQLCPANTLQMQFRAAGFVSHGATVTAYGALQKLHDAWRIKSPHRTIKNHSLYLQTSYGNAKFLPRKAFRKHNVKHPSEICHFQKRPALCTAATVSNLLAHFNPLVWLTHALCHLCVNSSPGHLCALSSPLTSMFYIQ